MTARKFIRLFGGVAVAWSLAAHAEETGTLGTPKASAATLPKIEAVRVKPVERTPPNLRLSDDRIDLMTGGFSLSSNQAIGGAWGIPVRPPTPFDERYGQWWNPFVLLTAVRGDDAMQMIEPQYFWGVMFFVAAFAAGWELAHKMRKRWSALRGRVGP